MTTYEDRARGMDDLDVAISKALAACNCDFGPGLDPCYCTPSAVRALVERMEMAALRDASFCDECKLPKMCPGTVHRITGVAEAEARGAAKALREIAEWIREYERQEAPYDPDRCLSYLEPIYDELDRRAKALEGKP